MMKDVVLNTALRVEKEVTEDLLAQSVGSGDVSVFATPMMVALMEEAASKCLAQFLDEGETSVGTHISTSHSAATPCGMKVHAVAKIIEVDGRKVSFAIKAHDEAEEIGTATHQRFVVAKEKFEQRADAKRR